MRIPLSCSQCSWEAMQVREAEVAQRVAAGGSVKDVAPLPPAPWYLADIEENNAYVGECAQGHQMRMSLQNVRFELLYESGVVATLVGFHREAVSSLAAALERFYEFAVEVFVVRAQVQEEQQDAAWKAVTKQSERQFGAFLLLFLVNFRRPFLVGESWATYERQASFRNSVIHQGFFPTPTQVLTYAKHVYELIRSTRTALVELDATAVEKVGFRHVRDGHIAVQKLAGPPKPDKDGRYNSGGTAWMSMMLSVVERGAPVDFEARLAHARQSLPMWGFPVPH